MSETKTKIKTRRGTRGKGTKKNTKLNSKVEDVTKSEILEKMKNNTRLNSDEFQKIEDELITVVNKLSKVGLEEYATYLQHPWRIVWSNLLAGTARGLGFLLGAAIVIAIISYLMTLLVDLPVIGEFFQNLNDFLETNSDVYSAGPK